MSELEKEYDAKLEELEATQQSLGDLQVRLNGLTHEHTTMLEQCNLQQQQMEVMVRLLVEPLTKCNTTMCVSWLQPRFF